MASIVDTLLSGQLLFAALVTGSLYALVALGLNLVYGTLRMLNVPQEKLHLVMNGASPGRSKLDVSEVERMLQLRAACTVPNDIAVTQSVNKGTPVAIDAPRSSVARALEQLVDRLVDPQAAQGEVASKRSRKLARVG